MVQRYLLQGGLIGPHDVGDWVGYEDYAKLEAELSGLKEWRVQVIDIALKASEEARIKIDNLEAELQKYKDQFPDYVECANCGSVTHVEGVEDTMGQSGRRKEDAQECVHKWDIDGDYMMQCVRCGKIE